jgi:hypothetical protein
MIIALHRRPYLQARFRLGLRGLIFGEKGLTKPAGILLLQSSLRYGKYKVLMISDNLLFTSSVGGYLGEAWQIDAFAVFSLRYGQGGNNGGAKI